MTTTTRLLGLLSLLQTRRDWPGSLLAQRLGVSHRTVRRDIEQLATEGLVDRVRGGATTPRLPDRAELGFPNQARRLLAEKRAIARCAAILVEPGMSVGLSGGTTTWALAQELRAIPELTIVTNSLPVADVFARPDRADEPYTQTVVLTGGVRTPSDALVGPVAVRAIKYGRPPRLVSSNSQPRSAP